jgi:hypothetical protein
VYDDEAIVSGAKVINRTKNTLTYTNENGNFSMDASVNDSIVLKSLFHHEKIMVLSKTDFDDILVIELKKSVNDLDEVLIKKEADVKPFDVVEANRTLKNQIQKDVINRPNLYVGDTAFTGNISYTLGLIIGLFKSKKPKEQASTSATFSDFKRLFETDTYFNMKFLKTELNSPEDYVYLFMEYCESQYIDLKLLLTENRFMLLDSLLKYSNEFHEILKADQKD